MLSERDQLITGIAQIIDHPTVYMGGPSRNALRIAKVVVDEFGAQLDAHPAPDTQAPERIDTSRENIERIYWLVAESKAGREVRTEALRLITALSAERDLASAKTAAAVMRMREDALARITPAARGWPDACTNAALAAAAREIKALPLPDTTALDALIAERVREARAEAFKEAANIVDDPKMWGLSCEEIAAAIRARASKEDR